MIMQLLATLRLGIRPAGIKKWGWVGRDPQNSDFRTNGGRGTEFGSLLLDGV